ncbi:hypothetical protein HK100_002317 [Physocladia obscura]|uniref:sn-1-specific diacylglycerol lipase n=1 Tax=Physocladia obscura TaxID=109957 RepID=A0AAD5SVX7_9FUNG|nr:hypothetical protein HK100_002317 [Physocladia obscura]
MGRLKIFNRRIPLAPDDVYIPAAYGLVLHSVWLASTSVVYAVIRNDCNISSVLLNFLLVLTVTLSIQVPLDALMMFLSMSGTVSRKGPRRYVSAVVQVSCFILVWELTLECYGIFVTYGPGNYLSPVEGLNCTQRIDSSSPILIHMVVIWSFLAIIFYFVTLAVLLATGSKKSGSKLDEYIKTWQARLNYFVGSGGLVDSDVLRDVAGELANYFKDFDWAPSDVAVGLLLLKREQKKITEIRQARRILIEQPEGFLVPTLDNQQIREELQKVQGEEESKRMLFMNGGRIGKLFKGTMKKKESGRPTITGTVATSDGQSNNWLSPIKMSKEDVKETKPLGISSHLSPSPITEVPSDAESGTEMIQPKGGSTQEANAVSLQIRLPEHQIPLKIEDDDAVGTERTVLREEIDDILHFARYAEVVYTPEEFDMIYSDRLHFHTTDNGIYRSPYLIVHDVDTDSIVIAIRGTYSASDVLVDLKFDVTDISIPDIEGDEDHLAHSGFLNTARNIVNDIRSLNILEPLLNDPQSEFYGCSLVVTGHSLGAGVAALVANFLRVDFPSTCCYAFEPPGCVVSARAAEHFDSFCTSIVMGDDVVARLSRNTLEMLKMDIARHLQNCEDPKWKVVGSVVGDRLCCVNKNSTSTKRRRRGARSSRPGLLHRRTPSGHLIPEDLAKLKRRTNSLRAGKNGEDNPFADFQLPTPPMYIPGKILHIEKIRRPPLNMNQIMNRQFAKVKGATKVVGNNLRAGAEGIVDFVFEGAEKLKDGVGEIGDFILDGADDIKDIMLDGAEGINKLVVGKGARNGTTRDSAAAPTAVSATPAGGGGPSGINALSGDEAASPVNEAEYVAPKIIKYRTSSLADILAFRGRSADPIQSPISENEPNSPMKDVENAFIIEDDARGRPSKGVSIVDGAGPREGRKDRRRRRKMKRARSAGNYRSKSATRDGFETTAEESGLSSNDEADEGARGRSDGKPSVVQKSKAKIDTSALTDTEIFSDSELVEFGVNRIKDEKQTFLDSENSDLAKSQRLNNIRSEKLNTQKSIDALGIILSPSIKPRAHKDAVPSQSITGKVNANSNQQADLSLPSPMNPISPNPIFGIIAAPQSKTNIRESANTAVGVPHIIHEESEDDFQVNSGAGTMGVRFQKLNASVISQDELVLSKPQYPPNLMVKGKDSIVPGPNIHGKYHYIPRWARKEEFQEIIVSRSMIVDHSPFDLLREFQAAPAGSVLGVVTRN